MRAEGELLHYIKKTYGTFFLNQDDELIRKMISRSRFFHYFSYGTKKGSQVFGKLAGFDGFYPMVEICYRNKSLKTTLSSIGTQSFSSAICAAAVGFYFEVPLTQIKNALSEFRVITKRRNELINKNDIWIIDDSYNANPDSTRIALENLRRYRIKGEIHIVLGDMLELGAVSSKEHTRIGRMVSNMGFPNLYTFGPMSYAAHLAAKKVKNNFHFSDKQTLIELLKIRLKKGDLLFVKGSRGMRMDEVVDQM